MNLIAFEPHFWEAFIKIFDQYYLSIAVDMSSVVSCLGIFELTHEEVQQYEHRGRVSIRRVSQVNGSSSL